MNLKGAGKMVQPKLYEVNEIIQANGGPLPVAKSTVYAYIKKGIIPCVHIGSRKFISSIYVDKLLNSSNE